VDRRHFLGKVVLGSAVVASQVRSPVAATFRGGGLNVKFVGMMGFVKRSDSSLLVAMPGNYPMHHYTHVPFLMARAGSPIAAALGLTPMPGVVAGAFDDRLAAATPGSFVFRCLDGTDIDITAGDGASVAVANHASQLAQMHLIAPGKRLRGNLRRWAQATITLQGGRLDDSAAHPDAGKIWSFGQYQQRLTDAALYHSDRATIRVAMGPAVNSFAANDHDAAELWVVSAAGPRPVNSDPKRLDHGILFEYLNDTTPVAAYCADAEGYITPASALPCAPSAIASRTGGVAATAPPFAELCYHAYFGGQS
jgi:hypothetical protein